MNKLWILAPLGVALAAAPVITKPIAVNAFDHYVQYLEVMGQQYDIQIDNEAFTSGYLSTEMVTRITFPDIQASEFDIGENLANCVDIKTTVSHSFLDIVKGSFASTRSKFVEPENQSKECSFAELYQESKEFREFYEGQFGDEGPITVETRYGLMGGATFDFAVKPMNYAFVDETDSPEPVTLMSSPITGVIKTNSELSSMTLDMDWSNFNAEIPSSTGDMALSFQDLHASADQHLEYGNLWLGSAENTISNIRFKLVDPSGSETALTLDQLLISGDTHDHAAKIHSDSKVLLKNINGNMGDMTLEVSIDDLDAELLSTFSSQFDALLPKLEAGLPLSETEKEAIAATVFALAKNVNLELDALKYELNDKALDISGAIKAKGMSKQDIEGLDQNPFGLLQKVLVELDVTLDKELISLVMDAAIEYMAKTEGLTVAQMQPMRDAMQMQVDEQIMALQLTGFIVEKEDRYSSAFRFADGEAKLNGQPIPLPL